MKYAILISLFLVGCSASDRMDSCGRMCRFGVKAYDDKSQLCQCNEIEDVCHSPQGAK